MENPDLDRAVEASFSCDLRPPGLAQLQSMVNPAARSPFTSSQTQLLRGDPGLDKYRYYKQAFDKPSPLGDSHADTGPQISFSTSVPPMLTNPDEFGLLADELRRAEPRLPTAVSHQGTYGAGAPTLNPDPLGLNNQHLLGSMGPGCGAHLSATGHYPLSPHAGAAAAAAAAAANEPAAKHRRTVSSPSVWDPKMWEMQHPAPQNITPAHLNVPTPTYHKQAGAGGGLVPSCSSTGGTPLASPLHSNPASGTASPVGRHSTTDFSPLPHAISTSHPGNSAPGGMPSIPSSPQPSSSSGPAASGRTSTAGNGPTASNKNTVTSGAAMPTNVVHELLQEVPPELQPVVLAKVTQRGRGGRAPAADPRNDPNIDPRKARRILANRQSAARSKLKQKMLLETLRVNKEVLCQQQGSVEQEVGRLTQLVAQLQARNKQLEEQVQVLTMQQRISNGGGGLGVPGANNWHTAAALPQAAAGLPGMPPGSGGLAGMPGVGLGTSPGATAGLLASLGQAHMAGLAAQQQQQHPQMGHPPVQASALNGAMNGVANHSLPPAARNAAPSLTMKPPEVVADGDDDADGWWKDDMEFGS